MFEREDMLDRCWMSREKKVVLGRGRPFIPSLTYKAIDQSSPHVHSMKELAKKIMAELPITHAEYMLQFK